MIPGNGEGEEHEADQQSLFHTITLAGHGDRECPTPEKGFHPLEANPTFPPMPKKRDGVMTVRISSEDKEQLLKIADLADVTLSDVVVRATRDYVRANPLTGKKAKS